ncbi:hypothetical protein V6N12_062929 [Hibiscus sabdariffa]|uniref:Uncharacterized protein n=1 Tax=Hibiscus sabdariffa TaxID=183260 RepID=A0ABR2FAC6_9ROSI
MERDSLSLDTRSSLSISIKTLEKPATRAVEDSRRIAIDSATLAEEAIKDFVAPPTIMPLLLRIIAAATAAPEEASKDASQFTLTKPGGGGLQL